MEVHYLMSTFALITLLFFDATTTLWITTLYFTARYKQFSMLIKLWVLTIYLFYGLLPLILQLFGCGFVYFMVNREKFNDFYVSLDKILSLTSKLEYLKKLIVQLGIKLNAKFNVTAYVNRLNTILGNMYMLIYNMVNSISPYAASQMKRWFDNLTCAITTEDSLLTQPSVSSSSFPAPAPAPAPSSTSSSISQTIDSVLSYVRATKPPSETEEIDKLLGEITTLSSKISSKILS